MEIVDRFGDWHDLLGLKAREQFWKEGFEITSRKDFRPECYVLHVRLIGRATAIAQVKVFYKRGIELKDGDRIPPFSEIHTLLVVKVEGAWLISGQEIVQQKFLGVIARKNSLSRPSIVPGGSGSHSQTRW